LAIQGLIRPGCEVLQPFIGCNIHLNVLHRRTGTKNKFGRSLLQKKVCSKILNLNNTIKINANQTIGGQYNFTLVNEASMKSDLGKEFIVKVMFRGDQRRNSSCTTIPCESESYI
jgi:hypothetical protein